MKPFLIPVVLLAMAARRASGEEPWLDSLRVPTQPYSVETC